MHHFIRPSLLASLMSLGLGACIAQPVDPQASGVFRCELDEDCPSAQSCLQGVCVLGELPSLAILSPEEDAVSPFDPADGEVRTMLLTIGGMNLDLVDPSSDPEAAIGAGQVQILLDGVQVALVDAGELSGTVALEVELTNRPGVHRLEARAQRSDGSLYDNEKASARRVFWLDDGRPHVAFKRPWPGTRIPLDSATIEVEVSSIGITMAPPSTQVIEGIGHTHIHYDELFPACTMDNLCDQGYQGIVPIVDDEPSADVLLPTSAAGTATLTALLREANHTLYLDEGAPVYDEIDVFRSDAGGGQDPS